MVRPHCLLTSSELLAGEYSIDADSLYPAIAISPDTVIKYNFGTEPYVFDIVGKYCEGRGLVSPQIVPNNESEQFWRVDVKRIVERMFPGALLPDEMVHFSF